MELEAPQSLGFREEWPTDRARSDQPSIPSDCDDEKPRDALKDRAGPRKTHGPSFTCKVIFRLSGTLFSVASFNCRRSPRAVDLLIPTGLIERCRRFSLKVLIVFTSPAMTSMNQLTCTSKETEHDSKSG